jgi:hypothetical protein
MINSKSVLRFAAILLLAAGAAPAWAVTDHPMSVALTPGDTLYIRFKLDDPSQVPSNFNTISVNFSYSAVTPSASTQTSIYDNNDVSLAAFNSVANFPHTGIGPQFIDPDLSNPVTNFCCGRAMAELSSYLDGNGMTSLQYQAGPGVVISEFRALWGNSNDGGGSSPLLDTTISYSLNSLPPPLVPEPAAAGLAMFGAATVLGVRRRRFVS